MDEAMQKRVSASLRQQMKDELRKTAERNGLNWSEEKLEEVCQDFDKIVNEQVAKMREKDD